MSNQTIAFGLKRLITNFPELQKAIKAKAKKCKGGAADNLANKSWRDIAEALSFIPGSKKIPQKSESVKNIFRVFYDFPIALTSEAFFKFLDKLTQTLDYDTNPAYKQGLQDLVAQVVSHLDKTVTQEVVNQGIESQPLYSHSTDIVITDKLKSHISSNQNICAI
jgi:hypothetical protein